MTKAQEYPLSYNQARSRAIAGNCVRAELSGNTYAILKPAAHGIQWACWDDKRKEWLQAGALNMHLWQPAHKAFRESMWAEVPDPSAKP